MIGLTRLNGCPIVVNAEMIESIEPTPDTVVSLANGKKLVVRESLDEVVGRVIRYRRKVGTVALSAPTRGLPAAALFVSRHED
jgi:flagellar protein FlbD